MPACLGFVGNFGCYFVTEMYKLPVGALHYPARGHCRGHVKGPKEACYQICHFALNMTFDLGKDL